MVTRRVCATMTHFLIIGSTNSEFISSGDFQICTDGNFHHRHLVSGGSSIAFHNPKHIIPKAFVDKTGEDIAAAQR